MFSLRRIRGFSLIEVLIALTILSIGLMGLAGLQGLSVMSSNRAHLQTQATLLAQEMIDRMRANPDQARSNQYVIAKSAFPSAGANCRSSSCTPQQLAVFDLLQWKCALGNYSQQGDCQNANISGVLPNGDGEVSVDDNEITVTVYWSNASGDEQSVDLVMQI